VVGAPSKRQMVTNPERTVYGVKRLIGQRFNSEGIQQLMQTLPYQVVASPNGDAWVRINDKDMSPEEVSSHILRKMKEIAEDYLGETVDEAIVTVPAYFDEVQRKATKDAGAIAGLQVNAILNEPTAAALAYGANHGQDQRLAVFDLGGGTFDVSILVIESGVFEVLSTHGDTELGGDDFDRKIIELLCKEFEEANDMSLAGDAVALQRLKEAAERAKIELSAALSTDINLPFLAATQAGPAHLQRALERSELEGLCEPLIDALAAPCERALKDARMDASDIDQVLLVGGMTRMPAVQKRVVEIFGREASKGVNPDEIVAMGAATQSGIMGGELQEVVLLDVTPHSLGIRVAGNRMSVLVPSNTTVPTRAMKTFATTEDNQTFVTLEVYQGESLSTDENRYLGKFTLGDLPPRPRGKTHVQVDFTMDVDGMLEVSATETETGKAATVTIEPAGGLNADQVDALRNYVG
jgi:molecular chaperone DnaK